MRFGVPVLFAALSVCAFPLTAQTVPSTSAALSAGSEIQAALAGNWVGVLEYRDYSEPAGSTKRVKLPTWLSVSSNGASLRFRYVYDDGPTKTVVNTELVTIDAGTSTWRVTPQDGTDPKAEAAVISGLGALKNGRGTLVLMGSGIDGGKPAEVRTTVRLGRNILEMLREVRMLPSEEFRFRDAYTFVRAEQPEVKAALR